MLENKFYLSIDNQPLQLTNQLADQNRPTNQSVSSPITHTSASQSINAQAQKTPAKNTQTSIEHIWNQAVHLLHDTLDPQIFNAWVKPLQVVHYEFALSTDGSQSALVLELGGPNRFTCDHLRQNYSEVIAKNIKHVSGIDVVEIVFKVVEPVRTLGHSLPQKVLNQVGNHGHASVQTSAHAPSQNRPTRIVTPAPLELPRGARNNQVDQHNHAPKRHSASGSNSGAVPSAAVLSTRDVGALNPKCNFSSFVVGPCNQFAHAASLRVAENPGGSYNPLFIYGGVGLGKTHLVNAIGNAARRRGKNVLLTSSEVFVNELISALRSNKMQQFRDRFRSLDLLIIDDIQFLIGKERTQEEFFHTFNALHQRRSQIVITSDKVPQDLIGLEERLRTRFASGLSADLQAPDFETRVAILLKKSETEGIVLPPEVASLLAEKIDTNVRELEGALNRLHAFSTLHNIPITLELAENALRTIVPERTREVTTELIQKTVAERFNTTVRDLVGKRRTQNIALPRQVAMHLCRKLTTCSYPEIGALFGGRDHSTVIHAYRVIEERISSDQQLKSDVEWLERKLRGR